MFGLSLWVTILLQLRALASSNVLKSHTSTRADVNNTNLFLQLSQQTNLSNVTTILPDQPSLGIYWPENVTFPNINLQQQGTNSRNATANPLVAPEVKYDCNSRAYGRNLNLRSCLQAIDSINDYDLPQTFGERGQGKWDINLPFRFLGSKSSSHSIAKPE